MKGSAPNRSRTGSQVPVTRNAAPNFRKGGIHSRRSPPNSSTARKRTRKANAPVVRSKRRSLMFPPVFRAIQYRDFDLKVICFRALSTFSTAGFGSVFLQAEDGIRDDLVTGVQTCALPIFSLPLEIAVEDNGAGVPTDLMPHLF